MSTVASELITQTTDPLIELALSGSAKQTMLEIAATIAQDGQITVNGADILATTNGQYGQVELARIDATHAVTRRGKPTTQERINGIVEVRGEPEERKTLIITGENGKRYIILQHAASVISDAPQSLHSTAFNEAKAMCARLLPGYRFEQSLERILYTSPGGTTNRVHMVTENVLPEHWGDPYKPVHIASAEDINKLGRQLRMNGYQLLTIEEALTEVEDMATFTQIAECMTKDEFVKALEARTKKIRERQAKEKSLPQVPKGFFSVAPGAVCRNTANEDIDEIDMNEINREPAMIKLYQLLKKQGFRGAEIGVVVKKTKRNKETGITEMEFLFAGVNNYRRNGGITEQPLLVRRDAVSAAADAGNDILTVRQARLATGEDLFEETVAGMLEEEDYKDIVATGDPAKIQEFVMKRILAEFGEETGLNSEDLGKPHMAFPIITGLYASATVSPEQIYLGTLAWEGDISSRLDRETLEASQNGAEGENEAVGLKINTFYDPTVGKVRDLKTYLLLRLMQKANMYTL